MGREASQVVEVDREEASVREVSAEEGAVPQAGSKGAVGMEALAEASRDQVQAGSAEEPPEALKEGAARGNRGVESGPEGHKRPVLQVGDKLAEVALETPEARKGRVLQVDNRGVESGKGRVLRAAKGPTVMPTTSEKNDLTEI